MILISLVTTIAVVLIIGTLFLNLSPEFGGTVSKEQKKEYGKEANHKNGIFVNQIPTSMDMDFKSIIWLLGQFINGGKNRQPQQDISTIKIKPEEIISENNGGTKITWFGHSALLLEIDGKNIFLDPMLGQTTSPVPGFGGKRYSRKLPLDIEKIPQLDLIIISHDHYDHLDYGSIKALKEKTDMFFVPLGVDNHLKSWGVADDKIKTFNWWGATEFLNLQFVFVPSRHFSGRGLTDRAATLWGSWIIKSAKHNIYFSGDGGYGPHFKEIGEKYGPFDFAMMECGQYGDKWAAIHMIPEETAQATLDIKAKAMMPIHWGAFTLALHSWKDPVERVIKKANDLKIKVVTPQIGEPVMVSNQYPQSEWWKAYK